jgi:NSS family neurotransmitter:Na+ symporter
LGQAVFSLSLGGTFMVVYGSYLRPDTRLRPDALYTALGDTLVGLLAGLAIFPAVFALGLEPDSGPGLLFETLPGVFAQMPAGWFFGFLFFGGLFGVAYLSAVAGFEVVVAGLTDNTRWSRRRAIWIMALLVWILSLPPSTNMRVFLPWDLTFGSGMQTLGLLLSVVTVGWAVRRSTMLRELSIAHAGVPSHPDRDGGTDRSPGRLTRILYWWLRYVVPALVIDASGRLTRRHLRASHCAPVRSLTATRARSALPIGPRPVTCTIRAASLSQRVLPGRLNRHKTLPGGALAR